ATRLAVALDEDGARRAARERLEPHRARAGAEVEDVGTFDPRRDDVEDGLAGPVGGRPRVEPSRRLDPMALAGTGDDPHVASAGSSIVSVRASASSVARTPSGSVESVS